MALIPTTTHNTTGKVTKIVKEKGKGESRITRNVFFKVILVVLSAAAIIAFIRPVLSDYYSRKISRSEPKKIMLPSMITGEDAGYHYLAGVLHDDVSDKSGIEKAAGHYVRSLRKNPADSQTWLALAKAYRKMGMNDNALYAIRKAVDLEKNNQHLIWEAGVFFLLLDRPSEAVQLFRRYIQMAPEEQQNVYLLCFSMGIKPSYILDNLIPDEYVFHRSYLQFLIENNLVDESTDAWKKIKTRFNPDREEYLRYCDFLIGSGDLSGALALWGDFVKRFIAAGREGPAGGMIWNGDFELPIENGGFDWRAGSSDGVRIFRDKDIKWEGFASLSVNFSGKTNPGIDIARQTVPVAPGQKYRVTGYIRTEKLTTQNGLVLEASNYLCDPFVKKTAPVVGTNRWQKVELEFLTPKKCKTIFLNIKREQSGKLDNRISGDAWIDSLTMTQSKAR